MFSAIADPDPEEPAYVIGARGQKEEVFILTNDDASFVRGQLPQLVVTFGLVSTIKHMDCVVSFGGYPTGHCGGQLIVDKKRTSGVSGQGSSGRPDGRRRGVRL